MTPFEITNSETLKISQHSLVCNKTIMVWVWFFLFFFVLLLSIVLCVCVCVLEPPGDMLYFEVIKLFNCVSIFWNGIISSLKNVFKNTISCVFCSFVSMNFS